MTFQKLSFFVCLVYFSEKMGIVIAFILRVLMWIELINLYKTLAIIAMNPQQNLLLSLE